MPTIIEEVENVNAILYRDVKDILNKTNLENILFSTTLMFLNNEELVEFINKLMEVGYEDIALDYVENIQHHNLTIDFSKLHNEDSFK